MWPRPFTATPARTEFFPRHGLARIPRMDTPARNRRRFHALAGIALAACIHAAPAGQQQTTSADGPWSGEATCVVTMSGTGYQEEQVHRWRLTGGEPRRTGDVRHWPAVWSAQVKGSSAAARWTFDVPEADAPIAIWEIPGYRGNNRIHIASQHALIQVRGTLTDTSGRTAPHGIQEWTFPVLEDVATKMEFVGAWERQVRTIPWAQRPADAVTLETCKFNLVRSPRGGEPATLARDATPPTRVGATTATVAAAPTAPATVVKPEGPAPVSPAPATPSSPLETATTTLLIPPVTLKPSVTIDRQTITRGYPSTVTLSGTATNFVDGVTTVRFTPGITVTGMRVLSPTRVEATIVADATASAGSRPVTMTTGTQSVSTDGPAVVEPLRLVLTPTTIVEGTQNLVRFTGTNTHFVQGQTRATGGPIYGQVSVTSPTTAVLDVTNPLSPGVYTVSVSTGDEIAEATVPFTVTPKPDLFGKSCDAASQIAMLAAGQSYSVEGNLHARDTRDWFRIPVNQQGTLSLRVETIGNVVSPTRFGIDVMGACGSSSFRSSAVQTGGALVRLELSPVLPPYVYISVFSADWDITRTRFRLTVTAGTPPPPPPDTTPDPFTFSTTYSAVPFVDYESNAITISGINMPAPISVIDGGYYSINGGPFVSTPGTVTNGARVRLKKQMSPGTASVSMGLVVGGVQARWRLTVLPDF